MPRTEHPLFLARLEKLLAEYQFTADTLSRSQPHGKLLAGARDRIDTLTQTIAWCRARAGLPPAESVVAFRPLPSPAGSGDANEH